MNNFKVYENEIPKKINVNLGLNERAMFARMLTAWVLVLRMQEIYLNMY